MIPEPLKRSLSRAIGRHIAPRSASETAADVSLSSPIPDTLEGETFGQRQHRAIRESLYLRPLTSDGVMDLASPTDYATLLAGLREIQLDTAEKTDLSTKSGEALDEVQPLPVGDQVTLIISRDTLALLQDTIETKNTLSRFERWAEQRRLENYYFGAQIENETNCQQQILSRLQKRDGSDFDAEAAHVSGKLEKLATMGQSLESNAEGVERQMQARYNSFYPMLVDLSAALDAAAIASGILEALGDDSDIPVEKKDFEEEYGYPIEALVETAGNTESLPTEIEACDPKAQYMQAMHDLAEAQQSFDEKDCDEYEEEAAIYKRWDETGEPPGEDKDEFSSRHLARKMAITRQLIEAEEAFDAAKKAALEAGVYIGHGNDHVSEDDTVAEPVANIVLVAETDIVLGGGEEGQDLDKVEDWMEQLPQDNLEFDDAASATSGRSLTDWEAKLPEDIEIWESGTDIAHDWREEKILAWQETCGVAICDSNGRALSI